MATPQSRVDAKLSLEIRTKTIEQTLVPLVTQITTLVNHRERARKSEKTVRALHRVGHAVNIAVEHFVLIGSRIADENPEIQNDMCHASKEARVAGTSIQKLTDITLDDLPSPPQHPPTPGQPPTPGTAKQVAEKAAMVRAARQLLSAITKVMLLADRVVVKQIIASKAKVYTSMVRIENVCNFTDFLTTFSMFGKDMVELAHHTGERQNDLKNEKQVAQMSAARTVLEKSTRMLLTTTKTLLRHPECQLARVNRDSVFSHMRKALDTVHHVVVDGVQLDGDSSPTPPTNGDSGISLAQHQPTASKAIKEFEDMVELTRVTLVTPNTESKLQSCLDTIMESTQDFTDSAYTSHENRERILVLCERTRHEITTLLTVGNTMNSSDTTSPNQEFETALLKTMEASKLLRKQLQSTAMDQASEMFRCNEDQGLLCSIKQAGGNGEKTRVDEMSVRFQEHSDQLQEVCKLLRHIALTEPLVIYTEHAEMMVRSLGPQAVHASQIMACYPTSKIAKENLDMFCGAWTTQINELSVLVKDINEMCQGKREKQVYLSLPRPGKHGTTAKGVKPEKLSTQEQAKIAKLGLEMKLITSEMDAEADKWEEPDNVIVRRAKNMSSMAFSMYLFTRGEGPLKNTQDLFTQSEYFAEEGTKLFKAVKDFSQQVPAGTHKLELMNHFDHLPILCQQLNFTIKSPTMGKSATFNKVDNVIQETKDLMNTVAKVITASLVCATTYNIDYQGNIPTKWRPVPSVLSDISCTGSTAGSHTSHSQAGSNGSGPGSIAGSDTSDRESVKSSRSDHLLRSMSLNRAYTNHTQTVTNNHSSIVPSISFEPRI